MLTPQDITNPTLKSGMGYKKKSVEEFLLEVQQSYLELCKENEELKEKASVLSEGVQYYKKIETTLQKSLVLAEKTANETIAAAEAKARAIEQEAKSKSNVMLNDAQKELNRVHNQIILLIQQYDKYKAQCKQFASTQLELLESNSYDLKIPNLDELLAPTTESSLNQESLLNKESSFDREASFDKESTVDREASFSKENSVDREASFSKENSVDREASFNKENSVKKKSSLDKASLFNKENLLDTLDKEETLNKESSWKQSTGSLNKESSSGRANTLNQASSLLNEMQKMDDAIQKKDDKKEKKKVSHESHDLKNDVISAIDFLKNNEVQKKGVEDNSIVNTPKEASYMHATVQEPKASSYVPEIDKTPKTSAHTMAANEKLQSMSTTSTNVKTTEKKSGHTSAENIGTRQHTQFHTQPLPEVKEIFMNPHKEETILNKEAASTDMEQRKAEKEVAFIYDNEKESAKPKDVSQVNINHHNDTTPKKEDMEINDVLSRLKNSFK